MSQPWKGVGYYIGQDNKLQVTNSPSYVHSMIIAFERVIILQTTLFPLYRRYNQSETNPSSPVATAPNLPKEVKRWQ